VSMPHFDAHQSVVHLLAYLNRLSTHSIITVTVLYSEPDKTIGERMMRIVSVEALSEETLELRIRMSRGEWEALGRPSINDKLPTREKLGERITEEEFVKLLCNYEGATLERIYDILQRAGIILVWKSKEQSKRG